jgi:para-aminobenzoate synthetase/4-amino-4-deoxychorismate lyase
METMRLEKGRVVRCERHLARLKESARYFGFAPPAEACESIERAAREAPMGAYRLRLTANRAGNVAVERLPFEQRRSADPQPVEIAKTRIDSYDPLIYHKTTRRAHYESARREAPGAFDVILWNERGEATELTIGNLVAELAGELVTPARGCGLLAGVFRQELLDEGVVRESVIPLEELRRASRLWLVNSLREWVEIRLER